MVTHQYGQHVKLLFQTEFPENNPDVRALCPVVAIVFLLEVRSSLTGKTSSSSHSCGPPPGEQELMLHHLHHGRLSLSCVHWGCSKPGPELQCKRYCLLLPWIFAIKNTAPCIIKCYFTERIISNLHPTRDMTALSYILFYKCSHDMRWLVCSPGAFREQRSPGACMMDSRPILYKLTKTREALCGDIHSVPRVLSA